MLRITAPHVDFVERVVRRHAQRPAGVAALREKVDAACREIGRDPAAIERTVAVQVRMTGGTGREMGNTSTAQAVRPLQGAPAVIAEELRAYAREGIGHVQLVLDPITRASIEEFAPVLRELDAG